ERPAIFPPPLNELSLEEFGYKNWCTKVCRFPHSGFLRKSHPDGALRYLSIEKDRFHYYISCWIGFDRLDRKTQKRFPVRVSEYLDRNPEHTIAASLPDI